MVARVELSEFEHLARLARRAPNTKEELVIAAIGASRRPDFEYIDSQLESCQTDTAAAMDEFSREVKSFYEYVDPRMWSEAMIQVITTDLMWTSFFAQVEQNLPDEINKYLTERAIPSALMKYPEKSIRFHLVEHPAAAGRLILYGRKLVGEIVALAQRIFAGHPELSQLVAGVSGETADVEALSAILISQADETVTKLRDLIGA